MNQIEAFLEHGIRHEHSVRMLEVASLTKKFVTGKGLDDIITSYRRNEAKDLKDQRIRLTNTPTKAVISKARKYFKKLTRIHGINILWPENDATAEIQASTDDFMHGQSLLEWIGDTVEAYQCLDPNAYIIYDRFDKRDATGGIMQTTLYPIVVKSTHLINVSSEKGKILALSFKSDRSVLIAKTVQLVSDFYEYRAGIILEYKDARGLTVIDSSYSKVTLKVSGKATDFYYKEWLTGTTEVPAMTVGVYVDEVTEFKTYVSWIDPAEQCFRDMIRDKSFLDVTKVLHVYARRWEFVKPCQHQESPTNCCERGILTETRTACPSCNGTGIEPNFTSEQQVMRMAMPKGKQNDLVDLSKMAFTEAYPIDLPTFLAKEVQDAEDKAISAIFNAGIVQRATGAGTATEANYEYEDIYDVLEPFAHRISRQWELAVRVLSSYREVKDFEARLRFPKDKKMKTLAELIESYKQAKDSGAGYDVQYLILEQIVQKMNEDNPEEAARIMNRYDWMPWSDKSESETMVIMSNRAPNDPELILYENFKTIFADIDAKFQNKFHELSREKQKEVIAAFIEFYKPA